MLEGHHRGERIEVERHELGDYSATRAATAAGERIEVELGDATCSRATSAGERIEVERHKLGDRHRGR